MIIYFFLLFGDFTYQPPAGSWLDYARSRQLSETRHLIVEHKGPVGDYKSGGIQKIFDAGGRFLYEIKPAQGAWFVASGVAGNIDTFLYQKHPDQLDPNKNTFHLWHPQYGDREIKVMGKNLAQDKTVNSIQLQDNRIAVLSEKVTVLAHGARPSFHLEAIDLKGSLQEIFTAPELPLEAYIKSDIDARTCLVVENSAFFHDYTSQQIQRVDLKAFGPNPIIEAIDLAMPNRGHRIAAGMVAYMSNWDGSLCFVLEGFQDELPLLVLAEGDKERTGYAELKEFWQAFAANAIYREGETLYAVHKDRFFTYDLVNNLLTVYRGTFWSEEWPSMTADQEVTASVSRYVVQQKTSHIDSFKRQRPELLRVIDVNAFRKTLN